jgi:hypothetical protein
MGGAPVRPTVPDQNHPSHGQARCRLTRDVPVEKYKKKELQLPNGLYPNREPKPGD